MKHLRTAVAGHNVSHAQADAAEAASLDVPESKPVRGITNISVDSLDTYRKRAAVSWQDGEARYHFWFDLKTRTIEGLHFSDGKPTIYKNSLVTEPRDPGYFNTRYLDATKPKNVAIIAHVWSVIDANELVGKAIIEEDAADRRRAQEDREAAFEHRKKIAAPALYAALEKIMALTFEDAVNGHLNGKQIITMEQIGEVYETARLGVMKVVA